MGKQKWSDWSGEGSGQEEFQAQRGTVKGLHAKFGLHSRGSGG